MTNDLTPNARETALLISPSDVTALEAVFLCLLFAFLFAIRDGLLGERIKASLLAVPLIGGLLEQAWRNPFDRIMTAGLAFALGGLWVDAGWWSLALMASASIAATLGHGSWFTIGRNALTDPNRGVWAANIFSRLCLTRPTPWAQPAPVWWDMLGMTLVGVMFVLPSGIILAVAGVGAWWALLPACVSPAIGYWIGWRVMERAGLPSWFPATRFGAALTGFGYGLGFVAVAALG